MERKQGLLVIGLSFLCHAAAAIQFWLMRESLVVDQRWIRDFHVLLAVCFALSLAGCLAGGYRLLFFAFQAMLIRLIGIPMGGNLGIEFSLAFALLAALAFYLPEPANLAVGLALLSYFAAGQAGESAWGVELAAAPAGELVFCWVLGAVVCILSVGLRHYLARYTAERHSVQRLDDTVNQLMSANIGFQEYAQLLGQQQTSLERKRISRDIHDSVGYTLVNLMMVMEAALDLSPLENERLRAMLRQARQQAQDGLNETRRAVRELRAWPEERPAGLSRINRLIEAFRMSTGVKVETSYANFPYSLGEELDAVFYRIVQEGMTNAFRHGRASRIRIYFWMDEEGYKLSIWDNGSGAAEIVEGVGFAGMRERISEFDGRFEVSGLADGFELSVFIPARTVRG